VTINYEENENWYCWYLLNESIRSKCLLVIGGFEEQSEVEKTVQKKQDLFETIEILEFYGINPIDRAIEFDETHSEFNLVPEEALEVSDETNFYIRPRFIDRDEHYAEFRVLDVANME
jgi:hypothetical protein